MKKYHFLRTFVFGVDQDSNAIDWEIIKHFDPENEKSIIEFEVGFGDTKLPALSDDLQRIGDLNVFADGLLAHIAELGRQYQEITGQTVSSEIFGRPAEAFVECLRHYVITFAIVTSLDLDSLIAEYNNLGNGITIEGYFKETNEAGGCIVTASITSPINGASSFVRIAQYVKRRDKTCELILHAVTLYETDPAISSTEPINDWRCVYVQQETKMDATY